MHEAGKKQLPDKRKNGNAVRKAKNVSYLHGNVIGFIQGREGEAEKSANKTGSVFPALPDRYGRGSAPAGLSERIGREFQLQAGRKPLGAFHNYRVYGG